MVEKKPVPMPDGVIRVVANNPGPMTFEGTNSYVFGDDNTCSIIDPGPNDADHLVALDKAIGARRVAAILLTHRHDDHSGLVVKAKDRFGAPLLAAASPQTSYQASVDFAALNPERVLADGDFAQLSGQRVEAVATPGHTSDHLGFALPDRGIFFSGDHVMGWSTTVVIPPDGSMRAYRASLKALLDRPEQLYLPGHGEPIEKPGRLVRSLLTHRRQREEMILAELRNGPATVRELVERLYPDVGPKLALAAGFSVKAHIVELFEVHKVAGPDPLASDGPFHIK